MQQVKRIEIALVIVIIVGLALYFNIGAPIG
jgi:hypothetical protein